MDRISPGNGPGNEIKKQIDVAVYTLMQIVNFALDITATVVRNVELMRQIPSTDLWSLYPAIERHE